MEQYKVEITKEALQDMERYIRLYCNRVTFSRECNGAIYENNSVRLRIVSDIAPSTDAYLEDLFLYHFGEET